ncbi:polysaccharide pyruvyl transferase family protein, partial [bacterium]|nr:polysaccharide pyruvyl transferase family protein [bacterium]
RQKDLMRKLAKSGLVEVCMVRDKNALAVLKEYGFSDVTLILDPAFFVTPSAANGSVNILGWRDYKVPEKMRLRDYAKRTVERIAGKHREIVSFAAWYDRFMQDVFHQLPSPKLVVVHDNREIKRAEELFGREYVFYSTDYREIFKAYSTAGRYIGSRIHGAVPSFIHGACVNVLYFTDKAHVIENSAEILSRYVGGIENSLKVIYIKNRNISFPKDFVDEAPDRNAVRSALEQEKKTIQEKL